MHFFYNLEEWINFLRAKSLVVSTRIHGSIMALHAGVPSMLLWHDSRTQEIADHAALPSMPFSEFDLTQRPEQVQHRIDYDPYRARYPIIYKIYKNFLNSNGVAHNLE
jgi:polysaccharide pyruvyl transferase WcaK-like protein